MRGFFEYLASRVPEALVEAQRVAAIPAKLCPPPPTYLLDRDEIQTLFVALAGQGSALRDRALLREYLDHVLFWNTTDLERKLDEFKEYYNRHRIHSALRGDSPSEISGNTPKESAKLDDFRWQSHFGGLYQLPMAS